MQYLDLGKARFVSTKADVLVEIKASAGLSCESAKRLGVSPGESWACSAIWEDVWICKSHDFRLSFVISSDRDNIRSTGIEDLQLEDIENRLEAAQVRPLIEAVSLLLTELSYGNS